MFPAELPLCPVDGCPQPHTADVWKAINQPGRLRFPTTALPEPGKPLAIGDLDQAVSLDVTERSREVDKLLREHLETHDVLDFVRTIHRLQQDIGQYESGIRPHMRRDPAQEPAVREQVERHFAEQAARQPRYR